jgi:hypothetical protein
LRGVRARRHNCGAPAPVGKIEKLKLNVTEIKKNHKKRAIFLLTPKTQKLLGMREL